MWKENEIFSDFTSGDASGEYFFGAVSTVPIKKNFVVYRSASVRW